MKQSFFAFCAALAISLTFSLPAGATINRAQGYDFPYSDPYFATLISSVLHARDELPRSFRLPALPGRDHVRFVEGQQDIAINVYKQRRPAPLIYLIPGVGGSASEGTATWLGEFLYDKGFSVITVPSPLSWRFILGQSTSGVPGFSPEDAKDLIRVMKQARAVAEERYGLKVTRTGILGYSLGGLNAAFVMRAERKNPTLGLERAVLINPPIHLPYAMAAIDRLAMVGMAWTPARRENIQGRVLAAGSRVMDTNINSPRYFMNLDKKVNFTLDEVKFIIGGNFRSTLADSIFVAEEVSNLGLLQAPATEKDYSLRKLEAMSISFTDYLSRAAFPYWKKSLPTASTLEDFVGQGDLLSIKSLIVRDPAFRLLHNEDDFLTRAQDLADFANAMNERAVIYPKGGHLGNLWFERNLDDLYSMFQDLK